MKRWLWAGLITLAVIWLAQQVILKPVIEAVATQVVGARVTIGSISFSIFPHNIRIIGLQIYNEQGFPPKVFFNASEVVVDADLPEVLRGKMHLPLVIFHLDKMVVYKNAQGKLNVDELKIVQEKLHDKNKGPAPNFKIDVLKLNIGDVVVEDLGKTPPLIEAYDLNLRGKTFNNVDSVSKLIGVVMFEALKPTAIQSVGLYAATTLLGVAFLPGLAIGVAIANDESVSEIASPFDQTYQRCLDLAKRLGQIKKTEGPAGRIYAKIYGSDITFEIEKEGWISSKVIIKARKYFLAKPEIAAGLMYQLKGGS